MFSASFVCLLVCWSVGLCIPTYHVILNMSCRLLPCDFTLVDLTAALSTGVATVMGMRYQGAEAAWMQWCKAGREWKHQKRAATCDAYRAANWLRMAARRVLEWIRNVWRPGWVFRYEISHLLTIVTWGMLISGIPN